MAEGTNFLAAARSKLVKRDLQTFKTSAHGVTSFHSFDPREKERYTERINKIMGEDPDYPPLDPTGNDVFKRVSDGRWLCRFLNKCQPDAVSESVIARAAARGPSTATGAISPFANQEVLNKFLEHARAVGLELNNVGSTDFSKADEEHKEHLILGVLWQLLRRQLANEIKMVLRKQAEEAAKRGVRGPGAGDAAAMARALKDPESFLCDWVNTLFKEGGLPLPNGGKGASSIGELSTTHSDILAQLVHSLSPSDASSAAIAAEGEGAPTTRATNLVAWATEHGIPALTQPEDLCDTNPRLIMPFVMGLFTWYHTNVLPHKAGAAGGDTVYIVRAVAATPSSGLPEGTPAVRAYRKVEDADAAALQDNVALLVSAGGAAALPGLVSTTAQGISTAAAELTATLAPISEILGAEGGAAGGAGADGADVKAKLEGWLKGTGSGEGEGAAAPAETVTAVGSALASVLRAAGPGNAYFAVEALPLL